MPDMHLTYDIIGLCCDENEAEKDDNYVIVVDTSRPAVKYDIPYNAPIFNNVYCGTDKDFE